MISILKYFLKSVNIKSMICFNVKKKGQEFLPKSCYSFNLIIYRNK